MYLFVFLTPLLHVLNNIYSLLPSVFAETLVTSSSEDENTLHVLLYHATTPQLPHISYAPINRGE
jgi:hypothetical protein